MQPPGGAEEQLRSWQDMWSTIELLRLLVARPEQWEARFTQGLSGLLSHGERLALPGEAERAVFVSADATLERHAAVDWTAGIAIQRDVREDGHWLVLASRLESEEDPELIINVAELLALVVLAAHRSADWQGRLVLYAGDNMVVRHWLRNRRARNDLARYLLRVLAFLENRSGFQVLGFYLRTYHNVTADFLTRAMDEQVRAYLERLGLHLEEIGDTWRELMEQSTQRQLLAIFGLDPEDARIAMQLRERRVRRQAPRSLEIAVGARLWDAGSQIGGVAQCWTALGGVARHTQSAAPPRGPEAREALKGCTVVLQRGSEQGIGGLVAWMQLCREHGADRIIVVGAVHARARLPLGAKG